MSTCVIIEESLHCPHPHPYPRTRSYALYALVIRFRLLLHTYIRDRTPPTQQRIVIIATTTKLKPVVTTINSYTTQFPLPSD